MTAGDTSFLLLSTCLVFIMIPGLGYFYSGLSSAKSSLSVLLLCFLSYSIVLIQWFVFGYSLVYASDSNNAFIGSFNLSAFSQMEILSEDSAVVFDYVFAIYQSTFAGITPALVLGAGAERTRLLPKIVFILLWTTIVYDPIAYWCWNPLGWLRVNGVLDFAGGSPVHVASGSAALAFTLLVSRNHKSKTASVANSPANVLLGTLLLWFGWNGFNGGSALRANARASAAIVATNLCAASSSLTWVCWQFYFTKKLSAIAFCSGAVTGLVIITPAAGFVAPHYAILMGIVGTSACYGAVILKGKLKINDTLDVFAVHGIGGTVGNLMTGIFTERNIAALDGTTILMSGLIEGESLIVWQFISCLACFSYSFIMTGIILSVINVIPGLSLNFKIFDDEIGLDAAEMGEVTYDYLRLLNAPKPIMKDASSWTGHRPGWFKRNDHDD